MRDSSRQPADGFHLLGLAKLAFSPLLGRDVAHDRRRSHDVAARIAQGRHGNGDVQVASIFGYPYRFMMLDAFPSRNFS